MSTTVYLDNKILHLPNVGMDDQAMRGKCAHGVSLFEDCEACLMRRLSPMFSEEVSFERL